MAGFVDFLKKAAGETEDFLGDHLKEIPQGHIGPVPLTYGAGVQNDTNLDPVKKSLTQTAEFVLGGFQKYVQAPTFGAAAKAGIDPTSFLPWHKPSQGSVGYNPLATTVGNFVGNAVTHPGKFLDNPKKTVEHALNAPDVSFKQQEANAKDNPQKLAEIQQRVQNVQQAPSFTGAFNAALAGKPWDQLALQVGYDPLTYLGGETQLAHLPGLADAAETSRLANAAYKGARGVDFAAAGLNKAIEAPIAGALKVAKGLGELDIPVIGKALELSKKGLASDFLEKIQGAINELRQRNFDVNSVQTGDKHVTLEFPNLGHAKDQVESEVRRLVPLEWKPSVGKDNTLSFTATLPDGTSQQDVAAAVSKGNIKLSEALPPFEDDAVEQNGTWWWDQPHEFTPQLNYTNPLTGDPRRVVQLTEGANKKMIFFDAKQGEDGKFSVLVQHFEVRPDGTELKTASPRFDYRLAPDQKFNTAAEALNAAQTKYETGLNNFYQENQEKHANKVKQLIGLIKKHKDIPAALDEAFPPTNFSEHGEPVSNVTDAFQQHTLQDAVQQLRTEVPRNDANLYQVRYQTVEPANTVIPGQATQVPASYPDTPVGKLQSLNLVDSLESLAAQGKRDGEIARALRTRLDMPQEDAFNLVRSAKQDLGIPDSMPSDLRKVKSLTPEEQATWNDWLLNYKQRSAVGDTQHANTMRTVGRLVDDVAELSQKPAAKKRVASVLKVLDPLVQQNPTVLTEDALNSSNDLYNAVEHALLSPRVADQKAALEPFFAASDVVEQAPRINTNPVRKFGTKQVPGAEIFSARQNMADDVKSIASNLGLDPEGSRANAAIKVLTPFVDANSDLFAEPGMLRNAPQLSGGVEEALQAKDAQALHQTVQDLFDTFPKAQRTAENIDYPLNTNLKISTEQLPFAPVEMPAVEMVRNQVTNLANAIKAPPQQVEQVMSVLSPVIEANPQHFIVQRVYDNPILRDGIQRAMSAPDANASRKILAQSVGKMDTVFSEMGMHVPYFEKFLGWMDTRHVTPASRIGEIDPTKLSNEASLTLQRVKNEMPKTQEVLENSQKYITKFNDEKNALLQQASELADANGALDPNNPLGNLGDARRIFKKYGSSDQVKAWDKFMQTWGFPRGDSAEQAYVNFASDTAMSEIKKLYDIEDKGGAHNVYNMLFGMYREKALLSVRYHVANALDMTVRSTLHGSNPLIAPSVPKLYAEYGYRGLPPQVSANAQRGIGPVEESSYGIDTSATSFWGGLKQAAQSGNKTNLGKLPVLGKIAGPAAAINRYLSLAMDNSFREGTFFSGFERYVQDQVTPRFTELAKQNLKPEDVNKLTDLMRESEFRIAPQEIGTQVTKLTRASGSTREEAQQLGQTMAGYWQQGLDEATRYGVDFTNEVFYKFADERQIEQLLHLKGWMPFHVWATRNIPHYAETLAQNPWLVRAYLEYRGLSDQQQKQLNLTGSFAGKLGVGSLPSLLVGGNNLAWINPAVAVSVFDQTQPHGTDPNANLFEKAVDTLGKVGLSPAPWISGTANILGYTHDAGTQPLFNPIAGPVQALSGVNLDNPTNVIQRTLRNSLSGILPHSTYVSGYTPPSGDPYLEYNVDKYIDQMSVELTGQAGNPVFERAKALPESQIYQDALKKAQADQRFNELYRFFSPVPLTTTNPTELAIRGAQAQLPQRGSTGYKEMLKAQEDAGNIGTAHFNTSFGDPRKTQINVGLSYLQELGWPQDFSTQVGSSRFGGVQYGHAHSGITDDQLSALFQVLPWFHQYYTWLQLQPQGSNTTINHFLNTNRNQTAQ